MEELEQQIYSLIENFNKKAYEEQSLIRMAAIHFDQSNNDYGNGFLNYGQCNITVTPSDLIETLESNGSWYASGFNC